MLVNFQNDYGLRLGILSEDRVLDITDASHELGVKAPRSMEALLENPDEGRELLESLLGEAADAQAYWRSLEELKLGPAVPRPGKVICVGLNYRRHAEEANMPIPEEPVLFGAFANTISASGEDIDVSGLEKLDYEAELAVVIGKAAKGVSPDRAGEHILGYCNANDLSERQLQLKSGQWLLGKGLDGFVPIGPGLRLADDSFDPNNVQIRGWLNGELRQDSHTSDMIFPVEELVSYISRYISLDPGDVILTGTPEGVIMGREDAPWMQPGDEYVVEVEGLGSLRNKLVASG